MDYLEYIQSDEWRLKREWALLFWSRRCVICYSPDFIEVHHRTYERLGHEWLTDLIVLCRSCHERHYKYFNNNRQYYWLSRVDPALLEGIEK